MSEPAIDLHVEKVVTSTPNFTPVGYSTCEPITYRIEVTNNGVADAANVELAETFDAALSVESITPSQGSCSGTVCNLGTITPDQAPVTIDVQVVLPHDLASGTYPSNTLLNNTATVSAPVGIEQNPDDNSASAAISTVPWAETSITKEFSPAEPVAGGPVTYTITVHSDGPGTVDLVVADILPEALVKPPTAISISGGTGICQYDPTGESIGAPPGSDFPIVACEIPQFGPGEDRVITIQSTLASDSAGTQVDNLALSSDVLPFAGVFSFEPDNFTNNDDAGLVHAARAGPAARGPRAHQGRADRAGERRHERHLPPDGAQRRAARRGGGADRRHPPGGARASSPQAPAARPPDRPSRVRSAPWPPARAATWRSPSDPRPTSSDRPSPTPPPSARPQPTRTQRTTPPPLRSRSWRLRRSLRPRLLRLLPPPPPTSPPPTSPPATPPPPPPPPPPGLPPPGRHRRCVRVRCAGQVATLVGTPGPDRLRGTRGRDVIAARGGNDVVLALAGDDLVCAGPGADKVYGGTGNDRIYGSLGPDLLVGGPGNDRIFGGGVPSGIKAPGARGQNDTILGGAGADMLFGGGGPDRINGGPGRDDAIGGNGIDRCRAERTQSC